MRGLHAIAGALLTVAAAPLPADDFVVIRQTLDVDRPVDVAWPRVGGYCAIADWLKVTCEYTRGSGDVGTVRRLNAAIIEVMVAQTPYSYTYLQTDGTMAATRYHGTLAAEAMGSRTRLVYTLVYDQAALATDALRASEHARLEARFGGALAAMKSLIEAR
ncbi:SRPBCC family protein [Glacieibacterium megasporae]|uniref:SRPBCC family protein n=1 Tax=Glacieibacterium megasporae TaxID=2835787 RepID=UPI001C1E4DB9|nr:SRPBCC family protein [Polymorphobacter megasporae]UAJ11758.1 SRPBCC family protein [Polymorphobacter megasporae]